MTKLSAERIGMLDIRFGDYGPARELLDHITAVEAEREALAKQVKILTLSREAIESSLTRQLRDTARARDRYWKLYDSLARPASDLP